MKQTKKILSFVQFSGDDVSEKNNGQNEWLRFNEKLLKNIKIAWFIEQNWNLFQHYYFFNIFSDKCYITIFV